MERLVRWDEAGSRYEITIGEEVVGFADARPLEGAIALPHTVVEPAFEGQGIGGDLVRGALEDLRARGRRVVPLCSFVAAWIDDHPDFADLVDTEALARRRG